MSRQTENQVGAAVRGQLREMLAAGPFTPRRAGDMLDVVESGIAVLRSIAGGKAAKRSRGGVTFGVPTSFGVMPLTDLFADATPSVAVSRAFTIAGFAVRGLGGKIANRIRELAYGAAAVDSAQPEQDATVALEVRMRDKLAEMLETPFTIPTAIRIERFLSTAIPLLQVIGPAADHVTRRSSRRASAVACEIDETAGFQVAPNPAATAFTTESAAPSDEDESTPDADDDMAALYGAGPGSPYPQTAPNNETFGARMIREIMAALPLLVASQKQTPEAMVMAIASAEAQGMPKLAAKLRKLMGLEKPEEQETPVNPLLEAMRPFAATPRPDPIAGVERTVELAAELAGSKPPEAKPEVFKTLPPKCTYMFGGFASECGQDAKCYGKDRNGHLHPYCLDHYHHCVQRGELLLECHRPECQVDAELKIGKTREGVERTYCAWHYTEALKDGTIHEGSDGHGLYRDGGCVDCTRGVGLGHEPGCSAIAP